MMKRAILILSVSVVASAFACDYEETKNIRYSEASSNCVLDVKWPKGVTNFATMVFFHGGGLTSDGKCYGPWPAEAKDKDPIAQVGCRYRVFKKDPAKNTTRPEDCLDDAAAAVAWTLRNIATYGGDPKKVFVSGVSAGGYQTAMIGMDPKWLAKYGYKTTDLCGIAPFTGQVTKHFNVRAIGFRDTEPRYAPKVDEWAPLYWCKEKAYPPICLVTGGRRDDEMPCRVEENELLAISLKECGIPNVEFHETEGSHNGGVAPSAYFVRDFMAKMCDCGLVGRFSDNERVVLVGDSVVRGGLIAAALQLYQDLRHPGSNVRVMTATADVLSLRPDRVFAAPDADDIRAEGLRRRVDDFAIKGVKTVLMTPPPGDAAAGRCAEAVRALAAERHLGLVDFSRAPRMDALLAAACIIDEMHGAPTVAQVSVDAQTAKVWPRANRKKKPETRNAVVSAVRKLPNGIAFTYAPKALPLPKTPTYLEADKFRPLTERFNQELFYVQGLPEGAYALAFDGNEVGTFSAVELEKGVNVALLDTPNQKLARAAANLTQRLREFAGRPESEVSAAEEDDLRERLNAIRPAVSRVTVVRK